MSEHTPGPWAIGWDGTGEVDSWKKHPATGEPYQEPGHIFADGRALLRMAAGRNDRDFDDDLAERSANARLIAAAVDLLEAAESLFQHHKIFEALRGDTSRIILTDTLVDRFDTLRAAIAKARKEG